MATTRPLTGAVNREKDPRGRHSPDFDRPNMSAIRLLLMGNTARGQRSVGNIILGEKAFPVSEAQKGERHDGLVAGRILAVITTADLLSSNLSEEERSQGIGRCLSLSAPGPHVFLWVQQKGTITQEDRDALRRFKETFGREASKYTMVLFVHDDHEGHVSVADSVRPGNGALHDFIQDFEGRYHSQSQGNHTQILELLEKIQEIVEENVGSYFTGENFKQSEVTLKEKGVASRKELGAILKRTSTIKLPERPSRDERRPRFSRSKSVNAKRDGREGVRILLVGRTGVGKSAAGNTILGREAFASEAQMSSVTRKCQKETGTVGGRAGGRAVAVIDTPGLFDTSLSTEDTQQEIVKCMALASPGPHVFLLVVSVGHFSQEERETLRLIKMTFGDKAEKYTMVLFTRGDDLPIGDKPIEKYIAGGHSEIKKLIEDCGGRCHVFNNKENRDRHQVIGLFKKIAKMNFENGGSCYSHEMFLEANNAMIQIQMKKEKEEVSKRELDMFQAKHTFIDDITRMMVEERETLKICRVKERKRERDNFNKFMQEAQERADRGEELKGRNEQGKEPEESLGHLTLLERKPGDEEGTEGASGTWRPEKHVRESLEDGEGEENYNEEDRKEQEGKVAKQQKFLRVIKMRFNGRDIRKSPQKSKKTKKREEENDGEKRESSKLKTSDKKENEAEKPTTEKKNAQWFDEESQGGEDRPVMQQSGLERRQGVKEEDEGKEIRLTEAEYTKLVNEMTKKYQELATQQAEELKSFIRKHPRHFEGLPRKKGSKCVIQ